MTPEENIIPHDEELPVTVPDSAAADIPDQDLTAPATTAEVPTIIPEVSDPEPAPKAKKEKKQKKKPHIVLRILLQLISLVLAVVLFATVTAGVLVSDLRQLTSAGGIKQLISAILTSIPTSAPAQTAKEAPQISRLSNWTIHYDETEATGSGEGSSSIYVDENGNVISSDGSHLIVDESGNVVIGGDTNIDLDEIPEDILTGGSNADNVGSLIDWLYDQVEESAGSELEITKEQVQNFVAQSTVSDFLSEKLAGFAEDFINGTENTVITTDEIMGLLEENQELLKSELNIELTDEQKAQIQESVDKIVVESDINNTIRQEVYDTVDEMLESSTESMGGIGVTEIQEALKLLVSDSLFNAFVILSVLLLALLCLVNYYNIPAGLTWAGIPCLLSGGILSLPIVILQNNADLASDSGAISTLLVSFMNIFKPIHYGLLGIGVALLAVSIIWRFIRAVIRKVQAG